MILMITDKTHIINKLYSFMEQRYSRLHLSFIKMPIQQMNSSESSEYSICLINSNKSDAPEKLTKLNSKANDSN